MIRKIRLFLLLLVAGAQVIYAQTRTITGTVTDESGTSLPGVTVQIAGTTRGTITDLDGKYQIQAEPEDRLLFRFVGMEEQEILVGEQNVIDIIMKPEAATLEEVVVVGYGVQKKESLVASISQTTGEELKKTVGGSDLTNAMTGLMPGVITIRTSGIPGGSGEDDEATEVYIRGMSTWNGGQPLILVDGVERSMMDVDPNEVESVSVLKDASATAVFGVKGANGVILITTKRGKIGKPQLSFEGQVTAKTLSKVLEVNNSYDGLRLRNLAIEHEVPYTNNSWNDILPVEILEYYRTQEYPELFPDVDWLDEFTNDVAWSHRYNMNVAGGTEFVRYFLSLGYLHEGDILATKDYGQGYDPDFQYDRYNFRSNLDFDLTKSTTFSVNLSGYYGKQQRSAGNKFNFWKGYTGRPPDLYPVRYSDGIFADYEGFDRFENAISRLNFGGLENENRSEINTDFILKQKLNFITKGLSAGIKISYDNRFETNGPNIDDDGVLEKWINPDILYAETAEDSAKNIIYKYPGDYTNTTHGYDYFEIPLERDAESPQNNIYRSLYYEARINYDRTFGKHGVTGLFLFNRRQYTRPRANDPQSQFTNFREDWVGRFTYDYDSRYFFEFNGAYNGSEKFDRQYRFGFFPSIAMGWMVSNESFFKNNLPWWNTLKMRYSWGQVGNDENIARWQYVSGWTLTDERRIFGSPYTEESYPIYLESIVANPEIRWETAEKQNLGIETGFFQNLIRVDLDIFWEHRFDMFIRREDRLSNIIFGKDLPAANIGELKSKGWELAINFSKATGRFFRYSARLHWARARDEIIYREDPELRPFYRKQAGYPIGQTRSQINAGFIDSWDEMYTGVLGDENSERLPGDFRQVDYNADGVINEDDNVPYQYPDRPEYNYGLWLGAELKGFSASIQFYGVYNVTDGEAYGEFHENYTITRPFHLDETWSPEIGRIEDATMPHLRYNTGSPKGELWQWDRSYLKIQSAEIGYNFTGARLQNMGITNFRLFLSGQNLFVWSQMPEDRDRDSESNRSYPLQRRYNLGFNVNF